MRPCLLLLLAAVFSPTTPATANPALSAPQAVVLGTVQDGGLPQPNCRGENCRRARTDPRLSRRVVSLALQDPTTSQTFLIDATPDIDDQLDALIDDAVLPLPRGRTPLDGILLTHAHVGHYAGLAIFGRETLGARDLPVFGSRRMLEFLAANAPWSQLVELSQICLIEVSPGRVDRLSPQLTVTPIQVPHRDELSDTFAYIISGPQRRLLWLPDIDRWDEWDHSLEELLPTVDYAFVDATFYSGDDLPDRAIEDIPHPLVIDTLARMRQLRPRVSTRVFLIHMNHSNPVLNPSSEIRHQLDAAGVEIATEGLRLEL